MASFSFLHCADTHLGCPMKGLGKMPSALRDRVRDAPAEAFSRLVQTAIDREVTAVVIAGDLFDAADRNLGAQVHLRKQLWRLDEAGIRTLVAAGNHDPLGSMARGIAMPPSVHLFGPRPEPVMLVRDYEVLAHVYGVSYSKSATYGNLAADFPRPNGPFNIAVLHTNVGDRPDFARYAPCRLDDLIQAGYDYWALGHVHTRETLRAADPVVHYPGNPQGLHTGEPGARGATLVQVGDHGAVTMTPVWTDVVRWHRARTEIHDMEALEDLVGSYAELAGQLRGTAADRIHVVRWTLTGAGPLHEQLARPGARADLADALRAAEGIRNDGSVVWLERLETATSPAVDLERLRRQPDWLGDMLRLAAHMLDHPPAAAGTEIDPERPPASDATSRAVRDALGELLENPRLVRALGADPWSELNWREIVARAESLAAQSLAPREGSA